MHAQVRTLNTNTHTHASARSEHRHTMRPPPQTPQVTRRFLNYQGKAVPRHLVEQLAAMEAVLAAADPPAAAPAPAGEAPSAAPPVAGRAPAGDAGGGAAAPAEAQALGAGRAAALGRQASP
jgi:hypothetical protein